VRSLGLHPPAAGGAGERLGATHICVSRVKRKHLELQTLSPNPRLVDTDPLHLGSRVRAEREALVMQPISSSSGWTIDSQRVAPVK
jgi:hypothetical protein